jgi:hypothetical protein
MRLLHLVTLVACLGCATAGTVPDPHRGGDARVITAEEIASVPASNLYELIQKLGPSFLQSRGQTSINLSGGEYPSVYLDGRPYGDMGTLRTLIPNQIRLVRYYSAAEGAARFGMTNSSGGVIEVTSR